MAVRNSVYYFIQLLIITLTKQTANDMDIIRFDVLDGVKNASNGIFIYSNLGCMIDLYSILIDLTNCVNDFFNN